MAMSLFDLFNPGQSLPTSPSGAMFGGFAASESQMSLDPRDHQFSLSGQLINKFSGDKPLPPPTPNALGILSGKNQAQNTEEALTLAQYHRSRPQMESLRNRLLAQYTNPFGEQEAVQRSAGAAVGSYDRSLEQASAGLSLNAGQQASFDKQANFGRGMAELQAKNEAARGYEDRKNTTVMGG